MEELLRKDDSGQDEISEKYLRINGRYITDGQVLFLFIMYDLCMCPVLLGIVNFTIARKSGNIFSLLQAFFVRYSSEKSFQYAKRMSPLFCAIVKFFITNSLFTNSQFSYFNNLT